MLPVRMGQSKWGRLEICLEGNTFLLWILASYFFRNCWKELSMPLAVIDQVNVLCHAEHSLLVFNDHLG
jgi:hypothetical protein